MNQQDNHDQIQQAKAALRRKLIQERDTFPEQDVERNSRMILERLLTFKPLLETLDRPLAGPVGLYAAFRGEPDIRDLTRFLMARGASVAFPAIVGPKGEKRLRYGLYQGKMPLEEFLRPGLFGVPEPPLESLMPFGQAMSVLIVPGVAFDEQGGRMGFGKGYYDRMIAALPSRPLLIGVAHPFQLQPEPLPTTPEDQCMDYIILPDRVIVVQ